MDSWSSAELVHSEIVNNPLVPEFGISDRKFLIACLIFGTLAVGALAYCISIAVKECKLYPLFIWLGGALTVVYEPLTDQLGGFTFPDFSQPAWVAVFERRLPIYMGLVYCFYVAVAALWIIRRLERDGITWQRWMTWWAASVPLAFVFELAPVNQELWIYWGEGQPLVVWNLPVWWSFCNVAAVSMSAGICFLMRRYVLGDRHSWALVLVLPLGVIGAHMIVSYPAIAAISSTTKIAVTTVGALGAILLSGLTMFLFGKFLAALAPPPGERPAVADVRGTEPSVSIGAA